MARAKVRGENATGNYELELEFEDSHVAELVARAVHGHLPMAGAAEPAGAPRDVVRSRTAKRARVRNPPKGYTPLTEAEADVLRAKMPSRNDLVKTIMDEPNRRHSLPLIAQKTLGRTIAYSSPTHGERRVFFLLQGRIAKARAAIQKSDSGGKFVLTENRVGRSRVYEWRRNT